MLTEYMIYIYRLTGNLIHMALSIFGTMIEEADGNIMRKFVEFTKKMTATFINSQLVKFKMP